jgi:hypothetical protein
MVVGEKHSYPLDIWGIGSVLYWLLVGRRLFEEEELEWEACFGAWNRVVVEGADPKESCLVRFEGRVWSSIPASAKQLLVDLLQV